MPHLVYPSTKYKKSYLLSLRAFQREGRDLNINYQQLTKDFAGFIKECRSEEKGIGLKNGRVPQTKYWLVEGDKFLGETNIRHYLNENLRKIGGHIGYKINPKYRLKGNGKLICKLALLKAKKLGLKKVLITCNEDNIGSKKIIEANGGKFASRAWSDEEKKTKLRYWITIS